MTKKLVREVNIGVVSAVLVAIITGVALYFWEKVTSYSSTAIEYINSYSGYLTVAIFLCFILIFIKLVINLFILRIVGDYWELKNKLNKANSFCSDKGFFLYGLSSDQIEKDPIDGAVPLGVAGYFSIVDQVVETGKVWFFFEDKSPIYRGKWSSKDVGYTTDGFIIKFYMENHSSQIPQTKGDYAGVLIFNKDAVKPIVGDQAYSGMFADLQQERERFFGGAYVEQKSKKPSGFDAKMHIINNGKRFILASKGNLS